jgi:hypothetical protein
MDCPQAANPPAQISTGQPVYQSSYWQRRPSRTARRTDHEKLLWDGPQMRFTNCDDTNKFLRTEYRHGWTI